MQYDGLYHRNFYKEVTEKNRVHYEYYNLPMTEDGPKENLLSNGAQPKDVQELFKQ